MSRVFNVSYYTFLEMVRNKVLYVLLFFALFIFVLGIAITQMTIGNELDIISDIGLGTIEIFSTILAIFLGISLVQKELSLKTLYPLLSKPLSRTEYVLGKFAGMVFLIIVEIFVMSMIFLALLFVYGGPERLITFLPAIYTIFLQTATVISIAVLCSTLTEPTVGAMLTIGFYLTGATSYNLVYAITQRTSENVAKAITALRYILPDFSHFNIKDNLVYGRGMEGLQVGFASFYALFIIVIVLSLSVIFFNAKEIN
jgi:ABC-type transport system involved in multi-copper enzyme maturation permease subunit